MSRRVATNAEQVFRQDAGIQAAGCLRYSQTVGPRWSDSEEEIVSRASNHELDRGMNEHGGLQSPPPPYSEQDHRLGGGQTFSNSRFNLYPREGGLAEYEPTSSGGRDRLVTNEHGERVSWPFPDHEDHENSSDDGDGDPDMIYLESGRVFPRSEWEANHPVEYSSEGPSDDTDGEVSQNHCRPMPRAGNSTPRHWSSEDDPGRSDRESPRVRSGHSAGARYSGRQSLAGRGRRRRGESRRHEDPQPRRRSSHH